MEFSLSKSLIFESSGQAKIYSEIEADASRIMSHLLESAESLKCQRVAILAEPGSAFISAFRGILKAGGCAVVLSPLHPDAESAYFCEDAQIRIFLVSESMRAKATAIASQVKCLVIEDLLSTPASARPQPSLEDAQAALQLYTSGTTGKPKGAVLTRGNLSTQQRLLREAWGLRESDVLLHLLPLHHMHGLCIALLSCLSAGAGVRFLGKFDAAKAWDELGKSTVLMAVPTIYSKLLAAYDAADEQTQTRWAGFARKLRLATSGSAALPVTLASRWEAIAGRIPLERFGMTEVGVALSNPLQGERRAGSVGLPLPSVLTRIVDGELWVGGPSVFSEYYRRPEATQEAFVVEEGIRYFRTGDTVAQDADGYFRILGRTSVDILKSGGYKLSALEIEEVFREHAAVSEIAVIGLPDAEWGDLVVACVVPKPGMEEDCAEAPLREFAKARIAAYKTPRRFVFFKELPRNALGKVLKPELKRQLIQINNA